MTDLRTAARQALEALEGKRYTACGWRSDCDKAITALRAALADHYCDTHCTWADHAAGCALADGDNLSPTGCDHCRHPLYAAIKCSQCGQPTERAENNTDWSAA